MNTIVSIISTDDLKLKCKVEDYRIRLHVLSETNTKLAREYEKKASKLRILRSSSLLMCVTCLGGRRTDGLTIR